LSGVVFCEGEVVCGDGEGGFCGEEVVVAVDGLEDDGAAGGFGEFCGGEGALIGGEGGEVDFAGGPVDEEGAAEGVLLFVGVEESAADILDPALVASGGGGEAEGWPEALPCGAGLGDGFGVSGAGDGDVVIAGTGEPHGGGEVEEGRGGAGGGDEGEGGGEVEGEGEEAREEHLVRSWEV